MKQVSPKIDDRAAEFYAAHFSTTNQGVSYTLEAFPAIYRRTLGELQGRFTEAELSLILDVVNGLLLTPQFAGQHLPAEVSDGVALEFLDRKWEIDGPNLIGKIQDLTIGQTAVLEIWAKAFWVQSPSPELADWCRALM
jgi:hypothetical protein